jgi:hypothetical protein
MFVCGRSCDKKFLEGKFVVDVGKKMYPKKTECKKTKCLRKKIKNKLDSLCHCRYPIDGITCECHVDNNVKCCPRCYTPHCKDMGHTLLINCFNGCGHKYKDNYESYSYRVFEEMYHLNP